MSTPLAGQAIVEGGGYGRVLLFRSYQVVRWGQLKESPEYQDGKLKCDIGSQFREIRWGSNHKKRQSKWKNDNSSSVLVWYMSLATAYQGREEKEKKKNLRDDPKQRMEFGR